MDAAASMIEKAILANPTYAEAFNNLGLIFLPSVPYKCSYVSSARKLYSLDF